MAPNFNEVVSQDKSSDENNKFPIDYFLFSSKILRMIGAKSPGNIYIFCCKKELESKIKNTLFLYKTLNSQRFFTTFLFGTVPEKKNRNEKIEDRMCPKKIEDYFDDHYKQEFLSSEVTVFDFDDLYYFTKICSFKLVKYQVLELENFSNLHFSSSLDIKYHYIRNIRNKNFKEIMEKKLQTFYKKQLGISYEPKNLGFYFDSLNSSYKNKSIVGFCNNNKLKNFKNFCNVLHKSSLNFQFENLDFYVDKLNELLRSYYNTLIITSLENNYGYAASQIFVDNKHMLADPKILNSSSLDYLHSSIKGITSIKLKQLITTEVFEINEFSLSIVISDFNTSKFEVYGKKRKRFDETCDLTIIKLWNVDVKDFVIMLNSIDKLSVINNISDIIEYNLLNLKNN